MLVDQKNILDQYVDACKLIEETEKDIQRLKKKRKTIIQTNVKGSNQDWPYQEQHFKIQGTTFTYADDYQLRMEEKLLEERKTNAAKIKQEAEVFMNTTPPRIQRIIRFKVFQKMTWEETAQKMGRKATAESVRKEYQRFFESLSGMSCMSGNKMV